MEPRFCGKCGKPLSECTCAGRAGSFGGHAAPRPATPMHSGRHYVQRFENIALCEGESAIRQYRIGVMKWFGSGTADVLVTNRRVIMHSQSNYLLMMASTLQEVAIDSITGISSYFGKGFKKLFLVLGIILTLLSFTLFSSFSALSRWNGSIGPISIVPWLVLLVGVALLLMSRRPSYLFSINAAASAEAINTSANMTGVRLSGHGTGILFTFKPTEESVTMMHELGACVMDIKSKGDYAAEVWKNV
ncbi:MAG: hypothetical protein GX418_10760 [Clostridiales bacterium]|nr:hypothetical protein [Clostridiales bacterium]